MGEEDEGILFLTGNFLWAFTVELIDCCRMEDNETETVKQIDALLDSKATDDDQLVAVDGVDLGSHLDVFHSILKQVTISASLLIQ